jgi:hypothetical protein
MTMLSLSAVSNLAKRVAAASPAKGPPSTCWLPEPSTGRDERGRAASDPPSSVLALDRPNRSIRKFGRPHERRLMKDDFDDDRWDADPVRCGRPVGEKARTPIPGTMPTWVAID